MTMMIVFIPHPWALPCGTLPVPFSPNLSPSLPVPFSPHLSPPLLSSPPFFHPCSLLDLIVVLLLAPSCGRRARRSAKEESGRFLIDGLPSCANCIHSYPAAEAAGSPPRPPLSFSISSHDPRLAVRHPAAAQAVSRAPGPDPAGFLRTAGPHCFPLAFSPPFLVISLPFLVISLPSLVIFTAFPCHFHRLSLSFSPPFLVIFTAFPLPFRDLLTAFP